MRLVPERLKHNGLFINMFLITMVIIIIVSTTIAWTTIQMAEQFFFQRFSIMNAKVMNQVKDRFETFNYSIVTSANNILESGTIRSVLTEKQTTVQQMTSFYTVGQQLKHIQSNLDPYEIEIILLGRNGVSFRTDRNVWTISDQELKNSTLVRNTIGQPKKLMYQYDQRPNAASETGDQRFIVASKALMDRISGIVYGSMYFAIRENEFRQFYSNYTSPGNHVFLVDRSGGIVSSDRTKLIGEKSKELLGYADKLKNQSHQYIVGKFMGKDQIILMDYLPQFDMYLFNIIDKQTAFGDLIDKKAIALVAMAIVLLALMIVFLASRRLTNSLTSLVKQIGSAPKHDFDKYVSVSGTYETRQIGIAFNSMLDELHEYVEQLILSQKEKRNAELAALQQQINPHFLYNTLTSIKFMVNQGEKQETEATIHALISLLQNTIGNVSETISVKQEIDNLKNYVLINQKRYGDRIKVNYFLAPDCMDFQIPKLILQPFMENSFFHGFNRKAEGYINVLVWRDSENLICEVVDNGDGMEVGVDNSIPKTKRKQQLFSGIGVRNVHERIQLIYGEDFGVTISSEIGNGTKVRILLPIHSI
ncbi:sensor histidine kinase [Bacillus salipaludis]|uniref:Sensor histidine kinase n=1 Tax=Bacillus salipaludis TaxID=2547811 RepID=A0AA90TR25_9BACI|nr:sensor histidine kinase [Bacillus salipaludis]MDQ6595680.1 sensor histidine kinase [Bacillus salipaludis]